MWYRQASVESWEDFAEKLATLAEETMVSQVRGNKLPNQNYKMAEDLKDLFLSRASSGADLRTVPAKSPEAYSNLRHQIEIYAILTYRGIAAQIDSMMSGAVADDMESTIRNKEAVVRQMREQVREATLGLNEYLTDGPKFKFLDDDDEPSIHQKVKRLPS